LFSGLVNILNKCISDFQVGKNIKIFGDWQFIGKRNPRTCCEVTFPAGKKKLHE